MKRVLITGGSGFIGSNLIRHILSNHPDTIVLNIDGETYAAVPGTTKDLVSYGERYQYQFYDLRFVVNNSCRYNLQEVITDFNPDVVIHCCAETHVDNSIINSNAFVESNVVGTNNLLNALRRHYEVTHREPLLIHVSTDEVYGSLPLDSSDEWCETSRYDPHSPYSATKAASDHLVSAFISTYHIKAIITNCCNNYGPYQHPEKFIPKAVTNLVQGKRIPVYGNGMNTREWIHVDDHCSALWFLANNGVYGQKYHIGDHNTMTNIELAHMVAKLICTDDSQMSWSAAVEYVADRPSHDLKYILNFNKIKQLGWHPRVKFTDGLRQTVSWYRKNQDWWRQLQ